MVFNVILLYTKWLHFYNFFHNKEMKVKTTKVKVTPKKGRPATAYKKSDNFYLSISQTRNEAFQKLDDVCMFCGFGLHKEIPDYKSKVVLHDCKGNICLKCLQTCLENQYKSGIYQLFCPICLHVFDDDERAFLYPDLNNKISEQITFSELTNVEKCKFCPGMYTFEPLPLDKVITIYNGRKLTEEQRICIANYAVTCPECHVSSCRNCNSVPFHYGETCQEHQWWIDGNVCRICGRSADPSTAPNDEIPLLTCTDPNCIAMSQKMCTYIHPCGHACTGICGEKNHPPCPECSSNGSKCPHCGKDLWGSLCLSLDCGHTIHLECASKIIGRSITGPELELPLCPTVGCGEFVKHPILANNSDTKSNFRNWCEIEPLIDRIAEQRIIAEDIKFHPEVASKLSPYARSGERAALNWTKKNLRFMVCHRHTTPFYYTSARKDDAPLSLCHGIDSCPQCGKYPFPNCHQHGFNYIQFKCDKCCNVGVRRYQTSSGFAWFCEICYNLKAKQRAHSIKPCKGNCKFSRVNHSIPNQVYARCSKCGEVVSKPKVNCKR